jgi:hypothetical protein
MSQIQTCEKSLEFHKQQVKLAKSIFTERVHVCNPDSQTHMTPFFIPIINKDNTIIAQLLDTDVKSEYITKLNNFWEKIGLSRLLYYIYLMIGTDNIEFRLNNYVFFSLIDLEDRYDIFCKAGQTGICDLAHTYLGMGHIRMLSFDLSSKKIYFRHEGGSNGYEQDAHFEFAKSVDLANYKNGLNQLDEFLKHDSDDYLGWDNMIN